ncbi:pyridoxamine 5'-phosphate oxidase family protein [Phenylobacterium immobile]|uniref:pyridoxamine 5'-phosphate oxidase family protein n=1 Tax=Phenylobacterium immobile TaxID=21 RepID=UPI000A3E0516|nr:pyridoxamine 5'-phosphate oxidase family protein [Phenylobacterium immobile]
MAVELTDEIIEHVNGAGAAGNPLLLATADATGKPRLSFRGSVQVFSEHQLGFWARNAEGATMEAIKVNPQVALMYRSPAQRVFLQFEGKAHIVTGADRDKVYDQAPEPERKADAEKKGVAVVIDLDALAGMLGMDAEGKPRRISL